VPQLGEGDTSGSAQIGAVDEGPDPAARPQVANVAASSTASLAKRFRRDGPGAPRWERRLLLYAPFTVMIVLTGAHTEDDAFITLRYAANVLNGHGPVFNVGERVQGFSSPLHLLAMVFVVATPGAHALLKAKLASLVFGFLTVREGGELVTRCRLPRWGERTAFVLIGSSVVLAIASSNGLETTLFAWLITLLVRQLLDGRAFASTHSCVLTATVAAAATLTRPEGVLIVVTLAVTAVIVERDLTMWNRCRWAVPALAVSVASVLASAVYYGDPLPNTYYAKNGPVARSVWDGLGYVGRVLQPDVGLYRKLALVASAVMMFQLLLLALGAMSIVTRHRRLAYLLAVVAAEVAFVLKAGGDWMDGSRFMAPVVVPLVLVEVIGLVALVRAVPATKFVALLSSGALLLAVALPLYKLHLPVWRATGASDAALELKGGESSYALWADLPKLLSCAPRGATLATNEIGHLGYARQDLDIIDVAGLTDRVIAHDTPTRFKTNAGVDELHWATSASSAIRKRIVRSMPDVIAFVDQGATTTRSLLKGRYERVARYRYPPSVLTIFARRDSGVCPNPRLASHRAGRFAFRAS
jgi:hypothetical protein